MKRCVESVLYACTFAFLTVFWALSFTALFGGILGAVFAFYCPGGWDLSRFIVMCGVMPFSVGLAVVCVFYAINFVRTDLAILRKRLFELPLSIHSSYTCFGLFMIGFLYGVGNLWVSVR